MSERSDLPRDRDLARRVRRCFPFSCAREGGLLALALTTLLVCVSGSGGCLRPLFRLLLFALLFGPLPFTFRLSTPLSLSSTLSIFAFSRLLCCLLRGRLCCSLFSCSVGGRRNGVRIDELRDGH